MSIDRESVRKAIREKIGTVMSESDAVGSTTVANIDVPSSSVMMRRKRKKASNFFKEVIQVTQTKP
jgi:hypothetical protein